MGIISAKSIQANGSGNRTNHIVKRQFLKCPSWHFLRRLTCFRHIDRVTA